MANFTKLNGYDVKDAVAIHTYDTVASFKADTKLKVNDHIQTKGYTSVNDGGNATYIIVDDETLIEDGGLIHELTNGLKAVLNVGDFVTPEMFGAYGDGSHDDSEPIQKAFDSGKAVEFSPKTYICFSLVSNNPLNIRGNGATLKKPQLDIEPYNMTVNEMNWIRILTITEDCNIDGVTFDNNCFTMWQVSDGYAQQQSSSVIARGGSKKIDLIISNCNFNNSASDGLHIVENINANISNCRSEDCFRGGLVCTGYGSEINVDGWNSNVITTGVHDGIDVEVDSTSSIDPTKFILNINNLILDYDLDVYVPENGKVTMNNVVMRSFDENNIHGFILKSQLNGNLLVANSILRSGVPETVQTYPQGGDIYFDNCKFIGNTNDPVIRVTQYQPDNITRESILKISNCDIEGKNFLQLSKLNLTIEVNNCNVECTNDCIVANGITSPHVKNLILQNSKFIYNGFFGTFLKNQYAVAGTANVYLYGNIYEATTDSGIKIEGTPEIYFDNTPFTSAYSLTLGNGANPKFYGSGRVIIVPTASDLTFRGYVAGDDIAVAKDTGYRYRYTSGTTWTQINN